MFVCHRTYRRFAPLTPLYFIFRLLSKILSVLYAMWQLMDCCMLSRTTLTSPHCFTPPNWLLTCQFVASFGTSWNRSACFQLSRICVLFPLVYQVEDSRMAAKYIVHANHVHWRKRLGLASVVLLSGSNQAPPHKLHLLYFHSSFVCSSSVTYHQLLPSGRFQQICRKLLIPDRDVFRFYLIQNAIQFCRSPIWSSF